MIHGERNNVIRGINRGAMRSLNCGALLNLNRSMKRKVCAQQGESLLESMAAAMIISLALMILAGSLISAARVNRRAAVWENAPDSEDSVLVAPRRSASQSLGNHTAKIVFGSSETLFSSESGAYTIAVYKNPIKNTTQGGDEYGGKAFFYYDLASSDAGSPDIGSSDIGSSDTGS